MATGYTAKLVSNGQTFNEFIMGCARAMGACVDMREESADAPIPERFEPSDYHDKRLSEAKETLECLTAMDDEARLVFGKDKKRSAVDQAEEWHSSRVNTNARLDQMSEEVRAWNPPSLDHDGFKSFMLDQLKISTENMDYSQKGIDEARAMGPQEYYRRAVDEAGRNISYHTKERLEEIERTESRNKWLKDLRDSIN